MSLLQTMQWWLRKVRQMLKNRRSSSYLSIFNAGKEERFQPADEPKIMQKTTPDRPRLFADGKLVWILLALEILLVAASAIDHGLNGDEAWLGEQAYFKAK